MYRANEHVDNNKGHSHNGGYRKIIFAWHVKLGRYLSMVIAFSVASETRNLKHAYAMRAAVYFILIWTLLVVSHAAAAAAIASEESAEDQSSPDAIVQSIQSEPIEPASQQANRKRLINIESLQENCRFESERNCRCSDFRFEQIDEIAFFELQTKVRIAADGRTYELGEDQHIETLLVTNSIFVNFPLHLFYALPQLSELDMRRCGVQNVSWESFVSANKLQILLLSDNKITELGESLFNYSPELEYLFISGNQLHTLHPNAFKGLRKLRHLDLSGNRLQQLPERLFVDLIGLQELFLADNQLSFISVDLLTHNTRLQTVSLHTNRLRQLDEYAFRAAAHMLLLDLSHNPELQVLVLGLDAGHFIARNCSLTRVNLFGAVSNVDLDDNQLQELYFSTPEALQHLELRNNSLAQLATLSSVPRLRHLNVADNPQLGDLPEDWQTPQLERLDLSNTGLHQLPLAALRGMPELRKLNVSANNISEIDPQVKEKSYFPFTHVCLSV